MTNEINTFKALKEGDKQAVIDAVVNKVKKLYTTQEDEAGNLIGNPQKLTASDYLGFKKPDPYPHYYKRVLAYGGILKYTSPSTGYCIQYDSGEKPTPPVKMDQTEKEAIEILNFTRLIDYKET